MIIKCKCCKQEIKNIKLVFWVNNGMGQFPYCKECKITNLETEINQIKKMTKNNKNRKKVI